MARSASGSTANVAIQLCGAASSVPGANRMAKLKPSDCQSILRVLAMVAGGLAGYFLGGPVHSPTASVLLGGSAAVALIAVAVGVCVAWIERDRRQ